VPGLPKRQFAHWFQLLVIKGQIVERMRNCRRWGFTTQSAEKNCQREYYKTPCSYFVIEVTNLSWRC
jgi:hypothetical protein